MTVTEASQNWGVTENTVIKYLAKGFIYDLSIENDQLILPDIKRPKIIPKNRRKVLSNICQWILESLEEREYINAKIIGINLAEFTGCMEQLIADGLICRGECVRVGTNIGYRLTIKGIERLHPKKNLAVKILPVTATANVNIGAGNVIL